MIINRTIVPADELHHSINTLKAYTCCFGEWKIKRNKITCDQKRCDREYPMAPNSLAPFLKLANQLIIIIIIWNTQKLCLHFQEDVVDSSCNPFVFCLRQFSQNLFPCSIKTCSLNIPGLNKNLNFSLLFQQAALKFASQDCCMLFIAHFSV